MIDKIQVYSLYNTSLSEFKIMPGYSYYDKKFVEPNSDGKYTFTVMFTLLKEAWFSSR